MSKYRVKVETYVVMDAKSNSDARAKAELAVRQAVADSYRKGDCRIGAMTGQRLDFERGDRSAMRMGPNDGE